MTIIPTDVHKATAEAFGEGLSIRAQELPLLKPLLNTCIEYKDDGGLGKWHVLLCQIAEESFLQVRLRVLQGLSSGEDDESGLEMTRSVGWVGDGDVSCF